MNNRYSQLLFRFATDIWDFWLCQPDNLSVLNYIMIIGDQTYIMIIGDQTFQNK